ncbi:MAG: CRISPR-associated protein Cas4 [Flavobacteriales bacterium]
MQAQGPDPIPISALQHWMYCPRQCALIHVEQVFADNVHTARGNAVHALVDEPGYELRKGVKAERSLPLWSDRIGLIGKADLVEFHPDGSVFPVEFKHGPKRKHAHDDIQLAAQAMCLEEMLGRPVMQGAIYHASSRRRRDVEIDADLRTLVEVTTGMVRACIREGRLPPPVNDARCEQCSLKDICQPEVLDDCRTQARLRSTLFDTES